MPSPTESQSDLGHCVVSISHGQRRRPSVPVAREQLIGCMADKGWTLMYSHIQISMHGHGLRPNNSFKPKPLRGSA
jgi:hypothetical protein